MMFTENHFFNTNIKGRKSLNGFLMDKFGALPEAGAVFEHNGLKFVAEVVGPAAIEKVRIVKST